MTPTHRCAVCGQQWIGAHSCPGALTAAPESKRFPLKLREPSDAIRLAAINYLATDGSHGVFDAAANLLRKARLLELIGGEAQVKAQQQRDREMFISKGSVDG